MAVTRPRSTSARPSASTTSPARPTAFRSPAWRQPKRRCRPNRRTGTEGRLVDLTQLRAALARGEKAALAAALARIERDPDSAATADLLDSAYADPIARVIGLTGPPGVGKSTLTGALISEFRQAGKTVGCIAVDPSSRRSGGALLGDRTRLATDPEDTGCFVRSMAARDRLGGLAGLTVAAMVLMRAVYDIVLIETVGVGQSETDIAGTAGTLVFFVPPRSRRSPPILKTRLLRIPPILAL